MDYKTEKLSSAKEANLPSIERHSYSCLDNPPTKNDAKGLQDPAIDKNYNPDSNAPLLADAVKSETNNHQ